MTARLSTNPRTDQAGQVAWRRTQSWRPNVLLGSYR